MRMPAQMPRFQAVITTVAATTDKPWPVFTSTHVSSCKACLPACFYIRKARGGGKACRPPYLFLGQIVIHERDRNRPRQTARDALHEQDQIGLLGEQTQEFTCAHSHEMMPF